MFLINQEIQIMSTEQTPKQLLMDELAMSIVKTNLKMFCDQCEDAGVDPKEQNFENFGISRGWVEQLLTGFIDELIVEVVNKQKEVSTQLF